MRVSSLPIRSSIGPRTDRTSSRGRMSRSTFSRWGWTARRSSPPRATRRRPNASSRTTRSRPWAGGPPLVRPCPSARAGLSNANSG
jgi:hypothetical protein